MVRRLFGHLFQTNCEISKKKFPAPKSLFRQFITGRRFGVQIVFLVSAGEPVWQTPIEPLKATLAVLLRLRNFLTQNIL